MYKTVFIFALMLALQAQAQAQAKDMSRCGTDDFGNTVCMDENGVTTIVPFSSEGNEIAASGVPAVDKENDRPRCGTDPFGNNVCR